MNKPDQIQSFRQSRHQKAPRAFFHDYCAPGSYMITITAKSPVVALSIINQQSTDIMKKEEIITPQLTKLGEYIESELLAIPEHCPKLDIPHYIIMPDHIHFILHVRSRLDKSIGKYLAPFTKNCSQEYTKLGNLTSFTTLFHPFDDRIIFNPEQLEKAIQYIKDNPRRYLIRRNYPDLFQRHLQLSIGSYEYAAYGNIFLLKSFRLIPIRIHRSWSEQQFRDYHSSSIKHINQGAIPISPAIHPAEKAIIRDAIESGSSVILLRDLSFNERFKPQGVYFDLCAAGRLLLLSPWPDNHQRRSKAGYTEFHSMNDHAARIAALPPTARFSISTPTQLRPLPKKP